MSERGRVRSSRIRCTAGAPHASSPGTRATGTHQALRMLPRRAPASMAMSRPSPVLVGRSCGCGHRATQERADELVVPLESARGDDDRAGVDGADVLRACRTRRRGRTLSATTRCAGTSLEHRLDAPVEACLEEGTDEPEAHAVEACADAFAEDLRRRHRRGTAERRVGQHDGVRAALVADAARPLPQLREGEQRVVEGTTTTGRPPGCSGW